MECMYCGAELELYDSYGNRDYVCYGNCSGKRGEIYKCPNHEGFDNMNAAMEYIDVSEIHELEEYLANNCMESWEEIVCDSSCHNVSGSFYTDMQGNLNEGYPC